MNLVQLQCFLSVSRTLNFTRSANELFFTQSHLSKNIASLEKELGFPLFERSSHSVRLTEQGACFAREIQNVPDLVTRATSEARKAGKLPSSVLRIGVMDGYELAERTLGWFYGFQQDYPQITLRFERYGFRGLAEKLLAGELALAVTMRQTSPLEAGMSQLLLERRPGRLVLSRRNPLSQQPQLTLSDCSGVTLVTLKPEEAFGSYSTAVNVCNRYGCQPGAVVECPNIESQFLELEAGDGMAILDAGCRVNRSPHVAVYPIQNLEYDLAAYWREDGADQAKTLLAAYLKARLEEAGPPEIPEEA